MSLLHTIILCLCFTSLFGQSKRTNVDTSFYNYNREISNRILLPHLDTTTNSEYYRIWGNYQVIDIWQNQDGLFSGKLTSWASEYITSKKMRKSRIYLKEDFINYDTALIIRNLFISSNVLQLPSDDSIPNWEHGADGITYIIEYSTPSYYSLKKYWTPQIQGSLKEGIQILSVVENAFALANGILIWKSFEQEIPFECYTKGSFLICRRVNKDKRKKTTANKTFAASGG